MVSREGSAKGISFFSALRVLFEANLIAVLIEKFFSNEN